jgi:hypothetical protein
MYRTTGEAYKYQREEEKKQRKEMREKVVAVAVCTRRKRTRVCSRRHNSRLGWGEKKKERREKSVPQEAGGEAAICKIA